MSEGSHFPEPYQCGFTPIHNILSAKGLSRIESLVFLNGAHVFTSHTPGAAARPRFVASRSVPWLRSSRRLSRSFVHLEEFASRLPEADLWFGGTLTQPESFDALAESTGV